MESNSIDANVPDQIPNTTLEKFQAIFSNAMFKLD